MDSREIASHFRHLVSHNFVFHFPISKSFWGQSHSQHFHYSILKPSAHHVSSPDNRRWQAGLSPNSQWWVYRGAQHIPSRIITMGSSILHRHSCVYTLLNGCNFRTRYHREVHSREATQLRLASLRQHLHGSTSQQLRLWSYVDLMGTWSMLHRWSSGRIRCSRFQMVCRCKEDAAGGFGNDSDWGLLGSLYRWEPSWSG